MSIFKVTPQRPMNYTVEPARDPRFAWISRFCCPRVAHLNPAFPPRYELFTPAYLSMLLNQKCCKICTIEKSLPSHYTPCFTVPSPRGTHAEPGQFPGVNPSPASPSCPHESLAGPARACLLGMLYIGHIITDLERRIQTFENKCYTKMLDI